MVAGRRGHAGSRAPGEAQARRRRWHPARRRCPSLLLRRWSREHLRVGLAHLIQGAGPHLRIAWLVGGQGCCVVDPWASQWEWLAGGKAGSEEQSGWEMVGAQGRKTQEPEESGPLEGTSHRVLRHATGGMRRKVASDLRPFISAVPGVQIGPRTLALCFSVVVCLISVPHGQARCQCAAASPAPAWHSHSPILSPRLPCGRPCHCALNPPALPCCRPTPLSPRVPPCRMYQVAPARRGLPVAGASLGGRRGVRAKPLPGRTDRPLQACAAHVLEEPQRCHGGGVLRHARRDQGVGIHVPVVVLVLRPARAAPNGWSTNEQIVHSTTVTDIIR